MTINERTNARLMYKDDAIRALATHSGWWRLVLLFFLLCHGGTDSPWSWRQVHASASSASLDPWNGDHRHDGLQINNDVVARDDIRSQAARKVGPHDPTNTMHAKAGSLTGTDSEPQGADGHGRREILVLYLFSGSDPEYMSNLRFFVREAVQRDNRSEYLILVHKEEFKVRQLRHSKPFDLVVSVTSVR